MFNFEKFIYFYECGSMYRIFMPHFDDKGPDFRIAPVAWTAKAVSLA